MLDKWELPKPPTFDIEPRKIQFVDYPPAKPALCGAWIDCGSYEVRCDEPATAQLQSGRIILSFCEHHAAEKRMEQWIEAETQKLAVVR